MVPGLSKNTIVQTPAALARSVAARSKAAKRSQFSTGTCKSLPLRFVLGIRLTEPDCRFTARSCLARAFRRGRCGTDR